MRLGCGRLRFTPRSVGLKGLHLLTPRVGRKWQLAQKHPPPTKQNNPPPQQKNNNENPLNNSNKPALTSPLQQPSAVGRVSPCRRSAAGLLREGARWGALTGLGHFFLMMRGLGEAPARAHARARTAGSWSEPVPESGLASVIASLQRVSVPIVTWTYEY